MLRSILVHKKEGFGLFWCTEFGLSRLAANVLRVCFGLGWIFFQTGYHADEQSLVVYGCHGRRCLFANLVGGRC